MRQSNDLSLKDALKLMINNSRMKPGLYQNRIEKIWREKMGTTIAQSTADVKLRGKKLYLVINSAPVKNELSYSRDKIVKMINAHLGEEFLEDVIIR